VTITPTGGKVLLLGSIATFYPNAGSTIHSTFFRTQSQVRVNLAEALGVDTMARYQVVGSHGVAHSSFNLIDQPNAGVAATYSVAQRATADIEGGADSPCTIQAIELISP
jgi:hypothetical protein